MRLAPLNLRYLRLSASYLLFIFEGESGGSDDA